MSRGTSRSWRNGLTSKHQNNVTVAWKTLDAATVQLALPCKELKVLHKWLKEFLNYFPFSYCLHCTTVVVDSLCHVHIVAVSTDYYALDLRTNYQNWFMIKKPLHESMLDSSGTDQPLGPALFRVSPLQLKKQNKRFFCQISQLLRNLQQLRY